MANNTKKTKTNTTKPTNKNPAGAQSKEIEKDADVLFQKIYDKWYAFSVVEDEAFMTEVEENEVLKRTKSNA